MSTITNPHLPLKIYPFLFHRDFITFITIITIITIIIIIVTCEFQFWVQLIFKLLAINRGTTTAYREKIQF